MKEVRYFYTPNVKSSDELPCDEAQHASRVLRLKECDEINLIDGNGCFYKAVLTMVSSKHCTYKVLETYPQEPLWKKHFHIAIAPTKMMERMEWMVEKATEIGVDEITFLNCRFSERKTIKRERLEKIVISAVKQSRKAYVPKINEMLSFGDFIKGHNHGARYIAHCYDETERKYLFDELKSNKEEDITVLIGPEGDFSVDEVKLAVDSGFIPITLGSSRLRTETAAISALMMLHLSSE